MDDFMERVEDIQRRLGINPDGDPVGQPGHNDHRLYKHIVDLEEQVSNLAKEVAYWKLTTEDPGVFWSDDNPPYRLDWQEEP